ncbi:hypothetical protein BDV38DRAFT_251349 [Aspergillus pseudotamarii]|uniref:Uncharacterized protein n=1 Tax=Aspergillus pseudotamarii TaxID=132259 RepID=A0A5N6SLZ7_ASPPS|nr:uncharacterized protein BDV38DRAFT_251349 [Aspergillus pseudotamarii]KAE8135726.1 hypothetical protein BDV38DRAFT_251349 [Aspergillus pseudotamarii]
MLSFVPHLDPLWGCLRYAYGSIINNRLVILTISTLPSYLLLVAAVVFASTPCSLAV